MKYKQTTLSEILDAHKHAVMNDTSECVFMYNEKLCMLEKKPNCNTCQNGSTRFHEDTHIEFFSDTE